MAKVKKPEAFKLRRKTKLAKSKSISQYSTRTGEVIWAWNQLHLALRRLFVYLVTPKNLEAGYAMWHSIRSDNVQRDILRAALDHMVSKTATISEGLEWLLDVVGKLAPYRNDAVHVPTILNWTESAYVTADRFTNTAPAKRLAALPNLRQFHRLLRDDLYALTNYASALRMEMEAPGKYGAFPPPPKLQSIPKTEVPQTRSQRLLKRTSGARGKA